ncbi:MAG: hypothetical protein LLG13_12880 [Bacteroidales bacterium]|nr:hypothetical protein [Bacteroidales bacterium]
MADNKLVLYQYDTKTIGCNISNFSNIDLSTTTPYLTVKKKASDVVPVLSKIGTYDASITTVIFPLSKIDTSIAPGDYIYDIVLDDSINIYVTITKDTFTILDGVR